MSEVTLRITKIEGEPVVAGIIGVNVASGLLHCSLNKVRKYCADGDIRYFWTNFDQSGKAMQLYKIDVMAIRKKLIRQQKIILTELEGK